MKPFQMFMIVAATVAFGCSTTEEQSDSRVRTSFKEVSFVKPQSMTIDIEHAKQKWSFHNDDFKSDSQSPEYWNAPEIKVGPTGTIKFHFFVIDGDGRASVEGEVSVVSQPNWQWEFEVIPSREDLEQQCDDCDGVQGFSRGGPAPPDFDFDKVFVIWRGHAI